MGKKYVGRSGSKKKRVHVRPSEQQLRAMIHKLCKAARYDAAYTSTSGALANAVMAAEKMLRGRWSNPREPLRKVLRKVL